MTLCYSTIVLGNAFSNYSRMSRFAIVRPIDRGGGGGIGAISPGPQMFRGPMRLLTLLPFWAASSHCFFIFHFPLHCLHEFLGRIINNAFMVRVSVDKFFDAHVNMSNKRH